MRDVLTQYRACREEIGRTLDDLAQPRRGAGEEIGAVVGYIGTVGLDASEELCLSGLRVLAHVVQLRAMARDAFTLRRLANQCSELVRLGQSAAADAEGGEVRAAEDEAGALITALMADAALARVIGGGAEVTLPAPLDGDQQARDLFAGLTSGTAAWPEHTAARYIALGVVVRRLGIQTDMPQRVADAFGARGMTWRKGGE